MGSANSVTHAGIGSACEYSGTRVGTVVRVGRGVTVRATVGMAGCVGCGKSTTIQASVSKIGVVKNNKTLLDLIFFNISLSYFNTQLAWKGNAVCMIAGTKNSPGCNVNTGLNLSAIEVLAYNIESLCN